jgi:predicted RNase H-like nuclease
VVSCGYVKKDEHKTRRRVAASCGHRLPMPVIAGIDSCPGGWLAVLVTFYEEVVAEEHFLLENFMELSGIDPSPSHIAVDIPIGLLEEPLQGGRECDRVARKVLGQPRSSSVFSPPVRSSLDCSTFEEGREYGLNMQSFGILPKVRELDRIMTPALQSRIREAHPEISFFTLAGLASAEAGKKKAEGRDERAALLNQYFFQVHEGLSRFPRSKATTDDILDAYACAWTAMRLFRGEAGCLPDDPPRDEKDLQMAIWY